jgi:hypothetical protein
MIQNIPLTIGVEQTFSLTYNDDNYNFSLRYSDYGGYWFVDITKDKVDEVTLELTQVNYIVGLKLPVNINALKYFEYLGLGGLALVDTDPDSVNELSPKEDLGDRLKLYRSI